MDAGNSEKKQPGAYPLDGNPPKKSLTLRSGIIDSYQDTEEQSDLSIYYIPGDGSCLFWAVSLAYLIPVKDDDISFPVRYKNLFGNEKCVIEYMSGVKRLIQNHNPLLCNVPQDDVLKNLVTVTFRNRVVDFIEVNLEKFEDFSEVFDKEYGFRMRKPDTLGGDPEIQAISLILDSRICVYCQNFSEALNKNEISHSSGKVTLILFRVNCSTLKAPKACHYNYGLQNTFLDYFRERLIDDTIFKLLQKYSCENSKAVKEKYWAHHDYNSLINNSSDNSKKFAVLLNIACVVETEAMLRVKNREKLEARYEQELFKIIEKYRKNFKYADQTENKDIIYNMCSLFKNPEHVSAIFGILENITARTELLKYAFAVLNIVLDELIKTGNSDLVLRILNVKEVVSARNAFLLKDGSDLVVLQSQRIVALTKIKKGLHEEAIEILSSIQDKIIHVKCSHTPAENIIKNIDHDKFCLSSLISSDIAYTKHLMGKCEESLNEYKFLHDKIIRRLGIKGDTRRLSYKMYKEILQSDEYKSVLAYDREYLDILQIRSGIAHELACLGIMIQKDLTERELEKCSKTLKSIDIFQEAINLREDVFKIKIIESETGLDVGKDMFNVANIYKMLANVKENILRQAGRNVTTTGLNGVLHMYYKSFEMYSVSFLSPELWKTHSCSTSYFEQEISWSLLNIAWIYKSLGSIYFDVDSKSALQNYKNALNIFQKLYKHQEKKFGKEHKYVLGCRSDISFINHRLGQLKLTKLKAAVKVNRKAC